jgi:hypothetical protein
LRVGFKGFEEEDYLFFSADFFIASELVFFSLMLFLLLASDF